MYCSFGVAKRQCSSNLAERNSVNCSTVGERRQVAVNRDRVNLAKCAIRVNRPARGLGFTDKRQISERCCRATSARTRSSTPSNGHQWRSLNVRRYAYCLVAQPWLSGQPWRSANPSLRSPQWIDGAFSKRHSVDSCPTDGNGYLRATSPRERSEISSLILFRRLRSSFTSNRKTWRMIGGVPQGFPTLESLSVPSSST